MSIENIHFIKSVPLSDWTGPLPEDDDDLALECYQSDWFVRGTGEPASFATPEDRRHYIRSECSVGDYVVLRYYGEGHIKEISPGIVRFTSKRDGRTRPIEHAWFIDSLITWRRRPKAKTRAK